MTILPEPTHFKKAEYEKFLKKYPSAGEIFSQPYVSGDGEEIALVKTFDHEVLVYGGLLSDEQKSALGQEAVEELQQRLQKPEKPWRLLVGLPFAALIVIGAAMFLWQGGFHRMASLFETSPGPENVSSAPEDPGEAATSRPEPIATATPAPTMTPAPTATPHTTPTATPRPTPSPTPVPTATPRPTPSPQATRVPALRQLTLTDSEGFLLRDVDGTYRVQPGGTILIEAIFDNLSRDAVTVTYTAYRGSIQAQGATDARYTAPDAGGNKDVVTLKVIDAGTGSQLLQRAVKIQTITR